MTTIAKWTAANGQVRVYFNNLPCAGRAKIWAQQDGEKFDIIAIDGNKNRSELNNLINDAERTIDQMAGRPVRLWADLMTLVA